MIFRKGISNTHCDSFLKFVNVIHFLFCLCPQILLLSMNDMNIAKLTSIDLPLFKGIINDLFPGVESPTVDYTKVSSVRHCHVNMFVHLESFKASVYHKRIYFWKS